MKRTNGVTPVLERNREVRRSANIKVTRKHDSITLMREATGRNLTGERQLSRATRIAARNVFSISRKAVKHVALFILPHVLSLFLHLLNKFARSSTHSPPSFANSPSLVRGEDTNARTKMERTAGNNMYRRRRQMKGYKGECVR